MSDAIDRVQADAMDRMYRLTRHVYDASRRFYLLGRDEMLAAVTPPPGARVLEMGCGTGRNLVAAARRWPGARLYGFDISAEMLKTADGAVARAGFGDRIRLAHGDATGFDGMRSFDGEGFDLVYVSYALSMIPPWREALAEGLRLTAPTGRFAVVDFGDCAGLGSVVRRALWGWLALFHVTPRLDLAAEMRRLGDLGGRTLRVERPYGGWAQILVLEPVSG